MLWVPTEQVGFSQRYSFHFRFCSSSLPPPVLHASQEARKEGLKYYKQAFGFGADEGNLTNLYVNPKADRIHFTTFIGDPKILEFCQRLGIKRVAAYIEGWSHVNVASELVRALLRPELKIEEMVVTTTHVGGMMKGDTIKLRDLGSGGPALGELQKRVEAEKARITKIWENGGKTADWDWRIKEIVTRQERPVWPVIRYMDLRWVPRVSHPKEVAEVNIAG